MKDPIAALIEAEALPESYRTVVEQCWRPLAASIARRAADKRPLLIGVNGAQGSGKSTACRFLEALLAEQDLRAVTLSLDDLYCTRAERERLARGVHPLFVTRGVPGTHDVALGMEVLDRLLSGRGAALPRFDKARDDRSPSPEQVKGAVDVVLFEGWCVGAAPQPEDALARPINRLEAEEDPAGNWRRHVNHRLSTDYARLFARTDLLVMLKVTGFEVVRANRLRQEEKLARPRPEGPALMDAAAIERFIAHYERLTRWTLAEMPGRADVLFEVDAGQRPHASRGLTGANYSTG
ncbi:kinase [Altericroceibacterium xinjiangense]|uniref:kinase n=1 Tax=Altericroceibacterium xinjiangense TaxID=762261 RepID=UPI000F7D86CD|nr:kinase [Altericroceibacterium xinjiangense]